MQDLFSNLEDMLCKRVEHPMDMKFLDALGEEPTIEQNGALVFHTFPEYGFSFSHDPVKQNIFMIQIFCRTPEFWEHFHKGSKPFFGSLPASVCCNDNRTSVQSKLGAHPAETYTEKAPSITPQFSAEQSLAYVKWLRTGEMSDPPEIARPVNEHMERIEAMPDAIVADVYDAPIAKRHFWFLIDDQRLVEIRLYGKV